MNPATSLQGFRANIFVLKGQGTDSKTGETTYLYQNIKGDGVAFMMHPTKPWHFLTTSNMPARIVDAVLEKFIESEMERISNGSDKITERIVL